LTVLYQLDFEDEPPDSDEAESEKSADSDSEEDHFEDAMEKLTL
jgi:diphthamide biosynthesis protein 3